jgi:hypothetical protein
VQGLLHGDLGKWRTRTSNLPIHVQDAIWTPKLICLMSPFALTA